MKKFNPLTIAAAVLLSLLAPMSSSAENRSPDKVTSAAIPPSVTFPYTFACLPCSMKITIKTVADCSKDCYASACEKSNLGCRRDLKK